jgi:hypothetical protein
MADKSLYDVCETLKANSDRNTALLTTLNASVLKLNNMMGSFLDIMAQQRMDMLEAMREDKGTKDAAAAGAAGAGKPGGSNIAMILAGIAAIASGFLDGIRDSIKALAKLARLDKVFDAIKASLRTLGNGMKTRFAAFGANAIKIIDDLIQPLRTFFTADGGGGRFVKGLRDTFKLTFTGAAKIFDDLIQPFKTLMSGEGVVGQRITKLFNSIVDIFKFPFEGVIDNVVKPFRAVFAASEGPSILSRIIGAITRPFTAAIDFIQALIKPIQTFFSAEGPIAKAFGVIKQAFSIFNEGSALMKGLAGIGRVIGRLFFPITLIMTAYDTIKGALAGFEDDGILGAIQGAITGLLNSVIGMPLDLLKDVIGWILGKFGLDNAKEALASFSFSDLIAKLIDGFFDGLKMVINGIIEAIATVVAALPLVPDSVGDKIRGLKFDTNVQEKKALDKEIQESQAEEKRLGNAADRADTNLLKSQRAYDQGNMFIVDENGNRRRMTEAEASASMNRKRDRADLANQNYMDAANRTDDLERQRAALDGPGSGTNVVDASTTNNNQSSSTQPVMTTTPNGFDPEDPMLAGA